MTVKILEIKMFASNGSKNMTSNDESIICYKTVNAIQTYDRNTWCGHYLHFMTAYILYILYIYVIWAHITLATLIYIYIYLNM